MGRRILVVDDSAVIRRGLADLLAADPSLEVVGTAPNGRIALHRVDELRPDLVILDLEMPEMDGLETLRRLRSGPLRPLVLVFSALTEAAGQLTLDALALGANDYITKPSSLAGATMSMERLRTELLEKVRALLEGASPAASTATPRTKQPAPVSPPRESSHRIDLLAIGASTGGPNAIADILPGLPPEFPVPILIVQHMPPVFTAVFAERLARESRIRVREAKHGDLLEPGLALVAPGDHHMIVRGREVLLHQEPPEHGCRPAVDVLFRSLASAPGLTTLAIVLTGMGYDGLAGAKQIVAARGVVWAQDAASSVVWSMPGSVAKAGIAERVLGVPQMAGAIYERVMRGRHAGVSA